MVTPTGSLRHRLQDAFHVRDWDKTMSPPWLAHRRCTQPVRPSVGPALRRRRGAASMTSSGTSIAPEVARVWTRANHGMKKASVLEDLVRTTCSGTVGMCTASPYVAFLFVYYIGAITAEESHRFPAKKLGTTARFARQVLSEACSNTVRSEWNSIRINSGHKLISEISEDGAGAHLAAPVKCETKKTWQ